MQRRIEWLAAGLALAAGAAGQQAISTRAGLVQRVEGRAQVSDVGPEGLPEDAFVHLEPGQHMRTLRGRAEVVLAPGAYARFNAYSEIELVSADFSDIQVRLIEGSLVVDLADGKLRRDYAVTILHGDYSVRPTRRGEYELVARAGTPSALRVHDGRAAVHYGSSLLKIGSGRELPLLPDGWGRERALTIDDTPSRFRLIDWSRRRRAELDLDRQAPPLWTDEPSLEELGLPPAAPTGPPQPDAPRLH